jgi:hypothetical protein
MGARFFSADERQEWLWETWRFVKQIFPLLLVGVFLASIARTLIPAPGSKPWLAGIPFGLILQQWCLGVYVLPNPGGSAGGANVPGTGDAQGSFTGISSGRPGTQYPIDFDHQFGDREEKDRCVCGMVAVFSTLGWINLWLVYSINKRRIVWK